MRIFALHQSQAARHGTLHDEWRCSTTNRLGRSKIDSDREGKKQSRFQEVAPKRRGLWQYWVDRELYRQLCGMDSTLRDLDMLHPAKDCAKGENRWG